MTDTYTTPEGDYTITRTPRNHPWYGEARYIMHRIVNGEPEARTAEGYANMRDAREGIELDRVLRYGTPSTAPTGAGPASLQDAFRI